MANANRQRLREAYGYQDDSRTFEEVYGDQADQLFEGYEVPERFRKLFEAEKAKNERLNKKLSEAMELMLHSTDKVVKGKAAKWREMAKATMVGHVGKDMYDRLTESRKLKEFGDEFEDEFIDDFDEDAYSENDALGLAEGFDDEFEDDDLGDGPTSYDDLDYGGDLDGYDDESPLDDF